MLTLSTCPLRWSGKGWDLCKGAGKGTDLHKELKKGRDLQGLSQRPLLEIMYVCCVCMYVGM